MRHRSRGAALQIERSALLGWGVAVVVAAILAAVVAAANGLGSEGRQLSRYLAPSSPREILAVAGRWADRDSVIPASLDGPLVKALHLDPLSSRPFYYAALRVQATDASRATRLLEEARRRNPRDRAVRLRLLESYVRAGNLRAATAEMVVLIRLMPDNDDLLVSELSQLSVDPVFGQAARKAIGRGALLDRVLERLAQTGADTDQVLAMAQARKGVSQNADKWRGPLIQTLVENGRIARARQLWDAFYQDKGRHSDLLYDPSFQQRRGVPPFAWDLLTSALGSAERSSSGLDLTYFGRESGDLARQLLTLAPGSYRLALTVEGVAKGTGSYVAATVVCLPAGAGPSLLQLPIRVSGDAGRRVAGDFTVPAGCEAQWLTLAGVAAEFPSTQSLQVRRVDLSRKPAA